LRVLSPHDACAIPVRLQLQSLFQSPRGYFYVILSFFPWLRKGWNAIFHLPSLLTPPPRRGAAYPRLRRSFLFLAFLFFHCATVPATLSSDDSFVALGDGRPYISRQWTNHVALASPIELCYSLMDKNDSSHLSRRRLLLRSP